MHSAIFVAGQPEDERKWQKYLDHLLPKVKSPDKGVTRLGENVWLLNLQHKAAVSALGHLVAFAVQQEIEYGILSLDSAPQWLPADYSPKTI